MAHKGKQWPLHFRRDLSLQVLNYNQGLARTYRVTFFGQTGTVGTAANNHPVDIVQVGPPFGPPARWASLPHVFGGAIVVYTAETVVGAVPQNTGIRLKVTKDDGTLLYQLAFHQPASGVFRNLSAFVGDQEADHPPQWIRAGFAGSSQTCNAVDWHGNPA